MKHELSSAQVQSIFVGWVIAQDDPSELHESSWGIGVECFAHGLCDDLIRHGRGRSGWRARAIVKFAVLHLSQQRAEATLRSVVRLELRAS